MPNHDLNILWTPSTTLDYLDSMLRWAGELGYEVVALNHILPKVPEGQITNPLPKITGPIPRPSDPKDPASAARIPFPKQILHRATLYMADPNQHHRLPQLAAAYDILALRPTTEKAYLAACTSITESLIISLDFTQRLGYFLKAKNVTTAYKRGVHFEICYAHTYGLPSSYLTTDATAKSRLGGAGSAGIPTPPDDGAVSRLWSAWGQLFTATRGRGLIISSEAGSKLSIRPPAAIRNLLAAFGLGDERGFQAQVDAPRLVAKNELLRRRSHAGVVEILSVASEPLPAALGKTVEATAKDAAGEQKKKKTTKKKGMLQQGEREGSASDASANRKRKAASGDASAVGSGAEGAQPMSKRQAKRMRKAARESAEENMKQVQNEKG